MAIDLDQRRAIGEDIHAAAPTGDVRTMWDEHLLDLKLVNPANRRRFKIVVVGTVAGVHSSATRASSSSTRRRCRSRTSGSPRRR